MRAPCPAPSRHDIRRLTARDFAAAFGEMPTPYVASRIDAHDFAYRPLDEDDRDRYIRQIVATLLDGDLVRAGEERRGQWEDGWAAHTDAVDAGFYRASLVPRYFGKYPVVRWQQELIAPVGRDFEYHSLAAIEDWLFDKYLRKAGHVYEFGCGTAHNLLRVRDVNPTAELWGLDWAVASQRIIARINEAGIDDKLHGQRFNLFEPDRDFALSDGAAVVTVAALEQLGPRFQSFVAYLLEQRPALCIHIEPIAELLDEGNLLDFLSLAYFKRRNYLSGFLDHLRALEREGRLTIHLARRTSIGSLFIDGYSVVVWSPAASVIA